MMPACQMQPVSWRKRLTSACAMFVLLSFATWYGVFRIMVGWYNAFHVEQPEPVDAPPGLRDAIFTTSSPGENRHSEAEN